jgi:hypothetical protein
MPTLQEPAQVCNPHTTRPLLCQSLAGDFSERFMGLVWRARRGVPVEVTRT